MRPSNAYIASFSTTGLLVGLALVLLTVVGALMAFRSELSSDRDPPIRDVTIDRGQQGGAGAVRARRAPAGRSARTGAVPSTTGVERLRPSSGPFDVADAPGGRGSAGPPRAPARGAPDAPPASSAGGGGGVVGEVGGGAESAVGAVSPEAGGTVSGVVDQVDAALPR
jgi:hypothetical protein